MRTAGPLKVNVYMRSPLGTKNRHTNTHIGFNLTVTFRYIQDYT